MDAVRAVIDAERIARTTLGFTTGTGCRVPHLAQKISAGLHLGPALAAKRHP